MKLQRRKLEPKLERHLLVGLVTSSRFLGTAAPAIDMDLLEPGPFKTVAEWCVAYHKAYGRAPRRQIEGVYNSWLRKQAEPDGAEAEAIRDLLGGLSKQYETNGETNVRYLVDQLAEFLDRKKLVALREALEDALLPGDTAAATAAVQGYKSVSVGSGTGVDVLADWKAWKRAFADPLLPMFGFPGVSGRFLNPAFVREGLVGVQGPEKRGKTWWCLEFAMRALRSRVKVAFFGAGDLSTEEVMIRVGVRLTGMPLYDWQCKEPVRVPKRIRPMAGGFNVSVKYDERDCPVSVGVQDAIRACKRFVRGLVLDHDAPSLMLSCHPTKTLTVRAIEGILNGWEVEKGFIPDVIIVDYADILAPEDPRMQGRDQINETWASLRRLAQRRKCLVITPTQADAGSYDAVLQSMKNFSEDKRKLAHVTGMLALNQTDAEKDSQYMRLNWLVLRGSPFSQRQCLYVGQCLTLGRAFTCGSLMQRDVDGDDE